MFITEGKNYRRECKTISRNITSDITDHFANYFIWCHEKLKNIKDEKPNIRFLTKNNKRFFKHQMDEVDWDKKVYSASDVDTAYNNFISEIQALLNLSFPLTKLSISGSKDKKWMTTGLKSSSNKKMLYIDFG